MPSLHISEESMFQVLQRQRRRPMYSFIHLLARLLNKILVFAVAFLIAACTDDIEKLKLSKAEVVRVQELQNPFGENYVRFNVPGEEQQVLLGLKECNVYRAKFTQSVVTEWIPEKTLNVFYPMWSACSRESLKHDGQYVRLSFCKTPIGAGGGCGGGGGDFRSINGKDWQFLGANSKWENFVARNNSDN